MQWYYHAMTLTLDVLFAEARIHKVPKGQVLISPHHEPTSVYFIRKGYVKAYDISLQGENQLMAISSLGEIFPLHWALDKEYRQLFYQAMTPVEVGAMAKEEFRRRVENDPPLLHAIIKLLLWSYRYSQQRIQNLEYRSAMERIAFRLLFLGKYFGRRQGNATKITVPLTYQDFADSLNITRDTANKSLLVLMNQGVISRHKQVITILDAVKLQSFVGDDTTLNN